MLKIGILLFSLRSISEQRRILLLTMFAKTAIVLVSAVSAAMVATIGGPSVLGVFAITRVLLAVFVLITSLGMSNSYPYLIGRMGLDPQQIYKTGVFGVLLLAFVQLIVWVTASPVIHRVFLDTIPENLTATLGLAAPFQLIQLHIVNFLRATNRVRLANTASMVTEILLLGALVVVSVTVGLSGNTIVHTLVMSWAIGALLLAIMMWLLRYPFLPSLDFKLLKRCIRFGVKTQASGVFQLLNYRVDQLIIGAFLGSESLGVYVVAAKAAELFRLFSRSVTFAVEPKLAELTERNAIDFVKSNFGKVFGANFSIMILGIVLVPYLLPLAFGGWSAEAIPIFYILCCGLVVAGGNGLIGSFNKATGRPEKNAKIAGYGLLVAIVLNLWLVPVFGVYGAATAATLVQATVTVFFWKALVSSEAA